MSEPMGKQKIEQLKIIHFAAGQGDCTLIIVRARGKAPGTQDNWHTISILIDTGKEAETDKVWKAIWNQIVAEGGTKLDFFVISHFDEDHYRHAGGILEIVQKSASVIGDGTSESVVPQYSWKDQLRVVDRMFTGKTHDEYDIRTGNTKEETKKSKLLRETYVRQLSICCKMATHTGHDLFADAGYELPNFQMLCVSANGYIGGQFEASVERANKKPRRPRLQENDFSLAFLIRFGSFRFYTGGDLHGTVIDTKDVTKVVGSMEEPLAMHVYNTVLGQAHPSALNARHVCAALVHHHGSKFSTLGTFINYFNPCIAVCSGSGNPSTSVQFPSQQVIARLRGKKGGPERNKEPDDVYPGKIPTGRTRGTCAPLFTFRVRATVNSECEEPALTRIGREGWLPCAYQDIILHVIDEPGRSPLLAGQPRIYVSRRKGAFKSAKTESRDAYEGLNLDERGLAYCDCGGDRVHENVALPTGNRP